MKAYTDIEKSKKLAEILPVESADMRWYYKYNDGDKPQLSICNGSKYYIPCWSLAALLEHLRKIDLFPDIIDSVDCVLMDIAFADDEDGKVLHPIQCLRVEGKTILDTCYKMIVKLNEQNLL